MTTKGATSKAKAVFTLLGGVLLGALVTAAVLIALVALVTGDSPTEALGAPTYVDQSEADEIDQVYAGEFQFFVGGGVAVFDCNDDLLPDLYIAGGTNPAALYVNTSEPGGALRFDSHDVPGADLTNVTGAYPIDIDSDGILDLAVLRVGENVMLQGTDDCGFERGNERWGIDGGDHWTVGFSAFWDGDDLFPTLAFGNYLRLKESGERDECEDHFLFRPNGDSYVAPHVLSPGFCTLSVLFSSWNRSGTPDLRMANDRHYYTNGQEQLWNMSDSSPEPYSEDQGWQALKIWGMGIASHDLTDDGRPEVYLTSQGDNKLQTLSDSGEGPNYEDMALKVGATAHRPFIGGTLQPSTAWHAEFGDVNNDGFMDLFVTKGNVDAQADFAMDDPNNLLLGQPDGSFVEGAEDAGIVDYARSRGGALADLNLDGLLDIVVVERREEVRLWRNTGEAGKWLAVELQQTPPNPDAIGAWIEVRVGDHTITSEVTLGGGHAGGELGPVHFGVGEADSVDVRVIWPDGEEGGWTSTSTDRMIRVERRDSAVAQVWP